MELSISKCDFHSENCKIHQYIMLFTNKINDSEGNVDLKKKKNYSPRLNTAIINGIKNSLTPVNVLAILGNIHKEKHDGIVCMRMHCK